MSRPQDGDFVLSPSSCYVSWTKIGLHLLSYLNYEQWIFFTEMRSALHLEVGIPDWKKPKGYLLAGAVNQCYPGVALDMSGISNRCSRNGVYWEQFRMEYSWPVNLTYLVH